MQDKQVAPRPCPNCGNGNFSRSVRMGLHGLPEVNPENAAAGDIEQVAGSWIPVWAFWCDKCRFIGLYGATPQELGVDTGETKH